MVALSLVHIISPQCMCWYLRRLIAEQFGPLVQRLCTGLFLLAVPQPDYQASQCSRANRGVDRYCGASA